MSRTSRRFRVGPLLASVLCLGSTPVIAVGGQPTGEQILAAYAKAIGGEATTKVKTMAVEFRFSSAGLAQPAKGQAYLEQPSKSYFVIHLSSMGVPDYESGVNGDTAWRTSPGMGFQLLEGDEKRLALRGACLNPFDAWQRLWEKAEMSGEGTVGGIGCYKIILRPSEGKPLTAYFDKRTGLLVQESIKQPSAAPPLIITRYSDYREVEGVRIPYRIEQKEPQPWVIEYTSVQLGASVPASRFKLPEAIKSIVESKADTSGRATLEPRRSVQLGEIREVASKITNRDYELIINYPYTYAQDKSERYPVVYFTDGFYDFPLLAMIYGYQIYDRTVAECFLVGFSYKGKNLDYGQLRTYDYTPTKSAQYGVGGGGREFLEVVEKEFIPFMETNYRVDPSWRALGGSSAGGLFALYAMFAKPHLFNAIIAVSPGVLWDNEWIFKYEEEFHDKTRTLPLSLYMTGAEKEIPEQPEFLEGIKRFNRVLAARKYEGLRYEFRLLDDARHAGSKPEGYSRGMQYIFAPLLGK